MQISPSSVSLVEIFSSDMQHIEGTSHFNAQFYNQSPGCFSFKKAQFVGKSRALLHFVSSEHRWLQKYTFSHMLCHWLSSGLYLQGYFFLTHLISPDKGLPRSLGQGVGGFCVGKLPTGHPGKSQAGRVTSTKEPQV